MADISIRIRNWQHLVRLQAENYIRHLDFKTHMFRHALIDRLKGCGYVPVPIAEAIRGHGRNASEFARFGSVGYTRSRKKR